MAKKFVLTDPDTPVRATEWKLDEIFFNAATGELSYFFKSPEDGRVTMNVADTDLQGAETAALTLLRNAGVRLMPIRLGFVGSEVEE